MERLGEVGLPFGLPLAIGVRGPLIVGKPGVTTERHLFRLALTTKLRDEGHTLAATVLKPNFEGPTMKVLVTGSTGYVGRAFVEKARASGRFQLRAAVRDQAGARPNGVQVVRVPDVSATTDWMLALVGCDAVLHAAARAHVIHERAINPLGQFIQVNTEGTLRLARQAAQTGVRRFVFVSSIGVNGAETHDRPFAADSPPNPHSPYAVSKFKAERGLMALADQTGLEVVIVRPPLVLGPNAPGNLRMLLRLLRLGLPLPLANVQNQRSFIGLDNLVDLLHTGLVHPAAGGEVFLASDGEDISTSTLLRELATAMGRQSRLFPFPTALLRRVSALVGRAGTAQQLLGSLQVDITKTRERLQWSPPIGLRESIRRAAEAS